MSVHVMIDLETWGTLPGSALRSIGAVTFSPTGEVHEEQSFYANIDRASCESVLLKIDPHTEGWWREQSEDAQRRLNDDCRHLLDVVRDFATWWARIQGTYVRSNGANFDEVLWRVACERVGLGVPWKYWNVRDTRTCWDLGRLDHRAVPFEGVQHDALADARHQAKCVRMAYAKLGIAA